MHRNENMREISRDVVHLCICDTDYYNYTAVIFTKRGVYVCMYVYACISMPCTICCTYEIELEIEISIKTQEHFQADKNSFSCVFYVRLTADVPTIVYLATERTPYSLDAIRSIAPGP